MSEEKKRALIFGGTGQMGTYLYEYLRGIGYYNIVRFGSRGCNFDGGHWPLEQQFTRILDNTEPDEIYNFASLMHSELSWDRPLHYLNVNGFAVATLLQCILTVCPKAKFFNAGSADMYDKGSVMQYEDTGKKPFNPHALSKMLAFEAVRMYREQKGLFACTGIFFNAESPRRLKTFFAQKVVAEAVRIKRELDQKNGFEPIQLGRLDARRDWGWAPEYVEVAHKMLQQEKPLDFVIGTGETHSCVDFVAEALTAAGVPDVDKKFNQYVKYEIAKGYKERDTMSARPYLAKRLLGWEAKYKMKDVVRMLVEAELKNEVTLDVRS